MGSICLSSASILRCSALSPLENIIVVIPTALEFLFSTSLLFVKWNGGKRHLLLAAEGWIYLTLSGIELLSDLLPAVRDNLGLFQSFDRGIGVASFLPILFYTFFLSLFTSEELLDPLPNHFKNVAKVTLIFFVPAIVIINEVASFVGIAFRNISSSSEGVTQSHIVAGFTSNRSEGLWSFFTSLTLALLAIFQAAVFFFAFTRLSRAILHQRHIENEGSEKAHLVNGTGWLCAAANLGALETVVGFAGGGFGITLTRRIMRMLSRACLCIGIVKGVDAIEDFRYFTRELVQSSPKNGFRQLISSPHLSTVRRLSPTAAAFHASPRAAEKFNSRAYKKAKVTEYDKNGSKRKTHYLTTTQRQSAMTVHSGLPGMKEFASVKEQMSKQRVGVYYEDGAPRLYMRLSPINLRNQALILESTKSEPHSEWIETHSNRRPPDGSTTSKHDHNENAVELVPPAPQFYKERTDASISHDSLNSTPPSSMNGPYEIVDARKLPQIARARVYDSSELNATMTPTPQAATSFPRSPFYRISDTDSSRINSYITLTSARDSIQAMHDLAIQFPGPPDISRARFIHKDPELALQSPTSRWGSPASTTLQLPRTLASTSRPSRWAPLTPARPRSPSKANEKFSRIANWVDTSATVAAAPSSSSRTVLVAPIILVEQPTTPDDLLLQNLQDRNESIVASSPSSSKNPPTPPLNIVKARRKPRPETVHMGHTKGSLHPGPIIIPPRKRNMPEAIQVEDGSSVSSIAGNVLGDAEVLQMEDIERLVGEAI